MATRDEVIYAFRFLLGRDPESTQVVDEFLSVASWPELRELFLACTEFKIKAANINAGGSPIEDYTQSPPNHVDVEISDSHFERLVRHVQSSWESLGREQPHWSVLTHPQFLPGNIDANIESFYQTGQASVHLLGMAAARAGKTLLPDWTCFELGCGVGRVTTALANRFKHIVAVDISHPHLELALAYLKSKSIENVTFLQLKTLATIESLEPFDIFYSVIVLQHNPPPLIYRLLQLIFEKVEIGGCVFFQVPVASPNYRFSIQEYLTAIEKGEGTMEMHALPQVYLFRLLEEKGFRILDIQRDNWTGPGFHSITVFAEKQRSDFSHASKSGQC